MRELKFRVWNGAEMVYDVIVGKFGVFYVNPGDKGNGLDPNDSASLTPFNTKYHEGTPVMQFTGLVGKDGKEIYEGDILKCSSGYLWTVSWNNDHACFQATSDRTCMEVIDNGNMVLVGNIYENKELLSSKA